MNKEEKEKIRKLSPVGVTVNMMGKLTKPSYFQSLCNHCVKHIIDRLTYSKNFLDQLLREKERTLFKKSLEKAKKNRRRRKRFVM